MSYRRATNLSTFFPDKYRTGEDNESRDARDASLNSHHRKDTYLPSHKDIFLPNGVSPRPKASGRTYPVRHKQYEESPISSSRYTPSYSDRRTDKYVPSPMTNTSSKSPSEPNNDTPHHYRSTPPTSSREPKETYSVAESDTQAPWIGFRDVKYLKQSHYLLENGDFNKNEKTLSQIEKPACHVVYDPEIKKDASKGNSIIYHKADKSHRSTDPRKSTAHIKSHSSKKSKRIPFRSLPLPKFVYDKHSVGGPPPNEIVISGLAKAFNETYLRNEIKSHGEILEFENVKDPYTGTPLGIIRIRFGGSPGSAYRSARHSVSALNGSKIEANTIRVGINKEGKLLGELKSKIIKVRASKAKIAEIQEKKMALPTAPKAVLQAISKREGITTAAAASVLTATSNSKPKSQEPVPPKSTPSSTTVAAKSKDDKPTPKSNFVVPPEMDKYVKGRPFILIGSKYVKGQVEKNDIKKALETYDWTRVLFDPVGVFIVFNSAKEAQRCYQFENGKRVLSVNLYMELHLPEGHKVEDGDKSYASTQRDVVEEATSLLAKELESAVQKDIRTKIIAPAVLNFLTIDNFPDLKAELAPPPATKKLAASELKPKSVSLESEQDDTTVDVFALHRRLPKIPVLKKKALKDEVPSAKKSQKKIKKALPMSYRLNFENEDESDFRESTVSTPQLEAHYKDEEEDIGPPRKKSRVSDKSLNNQRPLLYSSSSDEQEEVEDYQIEKVKETQPTTPETPEADKMVVEDQVVTPPESQDVTMEAEADIDYSTVEKRFRPTATDIPRTVNEEDEEILLDIYGIQNIVKDEEDLQLLKEIFTDKPVTTPSKFPEYRFWKAKNSNVSIPESANNIKFEKIPNRLTNKTGSHRSEGYVKVSDELKVEYLPHRKRVHDPLNTIQVESEENESSRVQSSRVNRANNRRFAYEVSTFNTQNEILTLNQLNKRKKPVSFARSAIHNWGLYALEPIAQKEMIIEYVGERIRQQVADFREKAYLKSGIGSSYLFRIDENTVIDATKKGGIARFINHCCQPSCTAKIIKVEGQKRIVIYALRDIAANEELTYDYKFERETNDNERVRCLCGAPGCKGYLN